MLTPLPALISHGRVISLPCDSRHVLVHDLANGRLLWSAPREGATSFADLGDSLAVLGSTTPIVRFDLFSGNCRSQSGERSCAVSRLFAGRLLVRG